MKLIPGLPREAKENEWVGIDTEFFGQTKELLHRPHGQMACISIAFGPNEVYQLYEVSELRDALRRLRLGRWILQNASYDIRQLGRFVQIPRRPIWDTMLVEQGLFAGWYSSFGLDDLNRRWSGTKLSKDVRLSFANATRMTQEMKRYAARDAVATYRVAMAQMEYIERELVPMRHYHEIDEPVMWAILDMPPARIDTDGWLRLAEHHGRVGAELEEELGFNVFSPNQVSKVLRNLGLSLKNTNGKDTLEPLVRQLRDKGKTDEANLIDAILMARMYRKAASTYGRDWVDQHVEPGGLVYGDYRLNGTRTCRMACMHQNLQNIPTRNMPVFRELFVPTDPKGWMFIADVWQQEPCITAWWSEDRRLKDALLNEVDLHQEAADDFGLTRREGKDVNLGLGYGMSEYGLSKRTGLSLEEARKGVLRRERRYPELKTWNDKMVRKAYSIEYVETSLGRRLWVNVYDNQWERNAINSPIQGTAAEQTKLWMIMCHQMCESEGIPFRIPLVVHDELVADVPPEEAPLWNKQLKRLGVAAGAAVIPGFPMRVEVSKGKSWGAK